MTKPTLTPKEEAAILAEAERNKNDHRRWLNRGRGWADVGDVPLTDDEKEEVLRKARVLREFNWELEQMRNENRARRKAEEEALRAKWDYTEFANMMKAESFKRGVKLEFNAQTLPILKAVCFRLSGNERYVSECGLSFDKGLIIHGGPGVGKTYPWQLVANNPVCPVQVLTMQEIVTSVQETGAFKGVRFADYPLIYIDDVGTEYTGGNVVKYYGTEINWFKDFIEVLYAKNKAHLSRIVITTNDTLDELGKKYGFRVMDRLDECFDWLHLDGVSFRGRNRERTA
jgi:DNA replication protein DnaC